MKLHPTCALEHITMVQFVIALFYLCHFELHSFGDDGNMFYVYLVVKVYTGTIKITELCTRYMETYKLYSASLM